jgi:hypothetical protein
MVPMMKEYKFSLVMENQASSGYITEKLIQGFLASTIPIYYGTTEVFDLFNPDAFIFWDIERANGGGALEQIITLAKDEVKYREMLSMPILKFPHDETLERYFSFQEGVGKGRIKKRISNMISRTRGVAGAEDGALADASHDPIIHGGGDYKLAMPTGKEDGSNHWSQDGQDSAVDRFLGERKKGFFLEIGGYDGELHDNTLFFEKERGWDGLLIEANPYTFKVRISNAPRIQAVA